MTRKEKTANWIKSLNKTREKRKTQTCKVFSLKFDKDKLTQSKLNYLALLFREAKLVYNHILALPDIFKFDPKITKVNVLDKNKNKIVVELKVIGSQMKQAIHRRIVSSVKILSKLKKSKKKVGRLKFKSSVNSIILDQFGITYRLNENYLSLQGNRKQRFKLLGLEQIPENAEITCANLVRKSGDFYLKVTTFIKKKEQENFPVDIIGIDAGCSYTLTLSDGNKYDVKFPVSKRTKFLQKKLKKKKKYSKNYFKHLVKTNKSIDKNLNKKKDKINKIVSEIVKKYKCICIQKESIAGWKVRHGIAVQASSIGGIMRALKNKARTLIEVDQFYPSTQICSKCGSRQKLSLWERVYNCPVCKKNMDRDINSAMNMKLEGSKKLPTGCREVKPVESEIPTVRIDSNNSKFLTMKQEALLLASGKVVDQRQEAPVFRQE